jgi:hypothetical protein
MECRHWKKIPESFGSKPRCAFDKKGRFNRNNWNCNLVAELREYEKRVQIWNDDNYLTVIRNNGVFVVFSHYKHRGKTDGFWIIDGEKLRRGTEKDAKEILKELKNKRC